MQSLIAAVLLILGRAQVPAANGGAPPPFEIKLSTLTPVIASGQKISIQIELKNVSSQQIDCSSMLEDTGLDTSFRYEVRDPDGKTMNIRPEEHADHVTGNVVFCTLQPGQTMVRNVDSIARVFDIRTPGTYGIKVSRPVQGNPKSLITSNQVTVQVR